jgi:hypothetical protein
LSSEEQNGHGRPERKVTELAVELTIAWLKRVESTADGRDPKEVVQAMDEFYRAIQRHHETEMDAAGNRERIAAH